MYSFYTEFARKICIFCRKYERICACESLHLPGMHKTWDGCDVRVGLWDTGEIIASDATVEAANGP